MALTSPPAPPPAVLTADSHETASAQLDVCSAQHRALPPHTPPPPPPNHVCSAHSHNHHRHRQTSPVPVTDVSLSPQRLRRVWTDGDEREVATPSPVRDLIEEEWRHHTPNSPLLTAVREAVDSINQYEDFEILEKIGAGFFADVFKVNAPLSLSLSRLYIYIHSVTL